MYSAYGVPTYGGSLLHGDFPYIRACFDRIHSHLSMICCCTCFMQRVPHHRSFRVTTLTLAVSHIWLWQASMGMDTRMEVQGDR